MDPELHSDPDLMVVATRNDAGFTSAAETGIPRPTHSDSQTIHNHIHGGVGGHGGVGRARGIGGQGGPGEGPTLNYSITATCFTMNNNLHGGDNHFHNPPQEEFPEFELIRLGNIKLRKELKEMHLDTSGVVSRGTSFRRMYTAELHRDPGPVTVAIYEGHDAEKEWRKDVVKYRSIRHPHIMQLYGLARTRGLCAMVFHDELIPFEQFIDRFQHSPVLTTYIRGYCCAQNSEAKDYLHDFRIEGDLHWSVWIRPATGNLCVDFLRSPQQSTNTFWWEIHNGRRLEHVSLDDPNAEAVIVSTFSEDEYHELCSEPPIAQYKELSVSTRLPIRLGSILQSNSQEGTLFRIADPFSMNLETSISWKHVGDDAEVLPNGWIRYDNRQVRDLDLRIWLSDNLREFWLAQANSIFTQLQETSHFDDYVCVDSIHLYLRCFPKMHNNSEPEGYLFVCPAEDFQTEHASFRWPDCPAYWSLEPSGATCLSTEDAKALGFPVIHIATIISVYSWDKSVYDGLRRFHQGKGFDPDSQDAAKHLGYPLYTLSMDVDSPLTYVEGVGCIFQRDGARCQKLGHYLDNSMMTSAPPSKSTSPDALFASSEDAAVDPLVPCPPAKSPRLIFSSFIFFLLGTVFMLSVVPTVM